MSSSMAQDPFMRPMGKRSAPRPPQEANLTGKRPRISMEEVIDDGDQPKSSHVSPGRIERSLPVNGNDVEDLTDMAEDGEDDRFFGGGLSEQQAQALDYLDAQAPGDTAEAVESLDLAGMRRLAAKFEKAITKNQKMRARYVDDPAKFLDSEAELDAEIKSMSVISEFPDLWKDFVDMDCLTSMISLVGHENSDIACDVIQVLEEITDEETNVTEEQFLSVVNGLKRAQGLEILVQNLTRLDEKSSQEREAVFRTCAILESVVNVDAEVKADLFSKTNLCSWLLARLQETDSDEVMAQNKQYAAELLSILVQDTAANIDQLLDQDGVDVMLLRLAPYRKKNPERGSIEEEYLENCFDMLNVLITTPQGKDKFIEGEGVELMQRLFMDAKSSLIRQRALQALEFGCSGWSGGVVCAQVVEVGLLRSLFSAFMKKEDNTLLKALLGIFVSFFRTLNDGEAERIRVINKFTESDFQKSRRLIELRTRYYLQHKAFLETAAEREARRGALSDEERAEYELTKFLDRLENGLDALQLVDVLIVWVLASVSMTERNNMPRPERLADLEDTLKEMRDAIKIRDIAEEMTSEEAEERQEHEMLEALIDVLDDMSTR